MLNKIKEYLLADDIELVQLGALLLQNNFPEKEWSQILTDCSAEQSSYLFSIVNGEIQVVEPPWLSSRKYTIRTGRGGMELIEKAFKKAAFTLPINNK